MDAANLVRNAKAASNKSHRALAEEANVAASTITRIQSHRIGPTVEVLEQILQACGYELELRAIRKGAPARPRLDDLIGLWEADRDGRPRLDWTGWRAWLDALARHPERVPEAIYVPASPSGDAVIDALVAAVAEKLADDSELPRPSWTAGIPALGTPYEPPARRRGQVPAQFAARGLLIDGTSLFRPKESVGL